MGTQAYDITRYQPGLFAARSLTHAVDALGQFLEAYDDEHHARLLHHRDVRARRPPDPGPRRLAEWPGDRPPRHPGRRHGDRARLLRHGPGAPRGSRLMDFGEAMGFGVGGKPDFWIGRLTSEGPTREDHIAFVAESREQVRAFFDAAVGLGAEVLHEPRVFPEYHEHYYGAFVPRPRRPQRRGGLPPSGVAQPPTGTRRRGRARSASGSGDGLCSTLRRPATQEPLHGRPHADDRRHRAVRLPGGARPRRRRPPRARHAAGAGRLRRVASATSTGTRARVAVGARSTTPCRWPSTSGSDHRWIDGTMTGGSTLRVPRAARGRRDPRGPVRDGARHLRLDQLTKAGPDARHRGFHGAGAAGRRARQFEAPVRQRRSSASYAMAAQRHMHEFGTTSEQLAEIAVDAREPRVAEPQRHVPRPHHGRRRPGARG